MFAQHQRLYLLLLKILEIERANNANNKEKRSIKDDVGECGLCRGLGQRFHKNKLMKKGRNGKG